MSYRITAQLNNIGAAYLESGNLRESLDRFRQALKSTAEIIPVQNPSFINPDAQVMKTDHQGSSIEVSELSDHSSDDKLGKPSPSAIPFVHGRAIHLIPAPTAFSPDAVINMSVVSGIILFNIGVVYHLKGLEGGAEGEVRLVKARSLYLKCYMLLSDAGVPLAATGNAVIDLLSMALFNNLAQVSFEMRCFDDSRSYFERLIRVALTVVPPIYGDQTIASMVDQQKSNFLLNAIILQAPKLAPAA